MNISNEELETITSFLKKEKEQGYSSPAGKYWDDFYKRITKDTEKVDRPRVPLILGGSIASDADKQERLREQLIWAAKNDRLGEGLRILDAIPREHWNSSDPKNWSKSFSWEDDE